MSMMGWTSVAELRGPLRYSSDSFPSPVPALPREALEDGRPEGTGRQKGWVMAIQGARSHWGVPQVTKGTMVNGR